MSCERICIMAVILGCMLFSLTMTTELRNPAEDQPEDTYIALAAAGKYSRALIIIFAIQ